MCGLKQGNNEKIKAYYKRMADITMKLEQYHRDWFGPGELSLMKKDCFYAGLKKYLVWHMKNQAQYGLVQMLKEIWEQEDSWYPTNMTPKPPSNDNQSRNAGHYDRKNLLYDKGRVYAVRPTDLSLPDTAPDEPDSPVVCNFK